MRTCAYYPVSIIDFDESGNVVGGDKENIIKDGFEDDFMDEICYSGEIYKNDVNPYYLEIPNIPELNPANINKRLLEIAKSLNKTIK